MGGTPTSSKISVMNVLYRSGLMMADCNITELGPQIASERRESLNMKVNLVYLIIRSKAGTIILMSVEDGLAAKGT